MLCNVSGMYIFWFVYTLSCITLDVDSIIFFSQYFPLYMYCIYEWDDYPAFNVFNLYSRMDV